MSLQVLSKLLLLLATRLVIILLLGENPCWTHAVMLVSDSLRCQLNIALILYNLD